MPTEDLLKHFLLLFPEGIDPFECIEVQCIVMLLMLSYLPQSPQFMSFVKIVLKLQITNIVLHTVVTV